MQWALTSLSDVLNHLRELRPDDKFVDDFCDNNIRNRSNVQNERGLSSQDFGKTGLVESEGVAEELA